ncbi:MAG: valine--tRNA ligase [Nannocystaceae bacterium]|nr:valine--tRNA ligase [Nannocystaceae bacterium]
MPDSYRTIDPQALPKHFDAQSVEAELNARWQQEGLYHYDASRPREETFVVDTPPPTVSGNLHIGHVFSYTHTDVIVRYKRMRGLNIFYPMGWDDNGLPTERRVQNHYHVRCDPSLPYEEGVELEQASSKSKKKPPRMLSRPNFIEACETLTKEDEKVYLALWQRLGLSVDWQQEYSTVGARCRKVAQMSFLDLYEKNHLYSSDAPTLWDVDFQTAIAQAELEDRDLDSTFNDIAFTVEGSDEEFIIATTRPELLPACVAVAAHPEDERYKHLFGKRAITPLFGVPVRIFASEVVDMEKGTGILMICTFGDQTDVQWWRDEKLPLRQVIGRRGRMLPLEYGTEGWESSDAAAANEHYAKMVGKRPDQARKIVLEILGEAPEGGLAPLRAQKPINHAVKFFEKGDRPLEFMPTRQWFCRLLDKKEDLLAKGEQVQWHPPFMRDRFSLWTENLAFDWCISRQRYFGVPFPMWYRLDAEGQPDYNAPLLPPVEALPIDPTTSVPAGYEASQRGEPGGFTAESDVFDTWFTSSMTPEVSSHWRLDNERHEKLFPADIRPQAHEIIRTWAFYTIAKAMLHEGKVPWHNVVISGWVVQPKQKGSKTEKISKSKGGASGLGPHELMDKFTADGVRYWSAHARLGVDTTFDENMFKTGKRLVTKLYNASKFALMQTADPGPVTREMDKGFLAALHSVVNDATASFEAFDFASALKATETFFWSGYTDSYVELVKARARAEDDPEGRASAVAALRLGLEVLLRLFAPFLPYISETVWGWAFAQERGVESIHAAPWPSTELFQSAGTPERVGSFGSATQCLGAINRSKTAANVGVARGITSMTLAAPAALLADLDPVRADVWAAAKVGLFDLVVDEALADFEVREIEFEPKPEKPPKA